MRSRMILALAITGALLTGCSMQPELDQTVSASMQAQVRAVADSAASGEYAAATEKLEALQAQLDAALAAGTVSAERAASIQSSIDLVAADLAALTPTPTPTPTPTEEKKGNGGGKDRDDEDD